MNESAAISYAEDASVAGIVDFIASQLFNPGSKNIAVPGGSTPGPILAALAERQDIDWRAVSVYPTDDRCVPADHPASNFGLLSSHLGATNAKLVPLEADATPPPFDLVWLGMGEDGHIASLFPNTDPRADAPVTVQRITPDPLPPEAPFNRLTLTIPALINARHMMLVIKGGKKRIVLDTAISGETDLPIARLLAAITCPVTLFWSET